MEPDIAIKNFPAIFPRSIKLSQFEEWMASWAKTTTKRIWGLLEFFLQKVQEGAVLQRPGFDSLPCRVRRAEYGYYVQPFKATPPFSVALFHGPLHLGAFTPHQERRPEQLHRGYLLLLNKARRRGKHAVVLYHNQPPA